MKHGKVQYNEQGQKLKKDGTPSMQGEGGGNPRSMEELYPDTYLEQLSTKLESFFQDNPECLYLFEFAIRNDFPSDYLPDFAERSDKFNRALKKAQDWQKIRLTKLGIDKPQAAAMTIFSLKNVAGWRDRQELSGDEKRPLKVMITDI